jgi:hypothetical protein
MYAVTAWKEWTSWRGRGRPVEAHELGELHGYNQDGAVRAAREQRRELHGDRFFLFFYSGLVAVMRYARICPQITPEVLTNFVILYILYKI